MRIEGGKQKSDGDQSGQIDAGEKVLVLHGNKTLNCYLVGQCWKHVGTIPMGSMSL